MGTLIESTKSDFAILGQYAYDLFDSGDSSARFGPCEVCNKHVSEVYHQVEMRCYGFKPVTAPDTLVAPRWTYHECKSLFGHRNCLEATRRKGVI